MTYPIPPYKYKCYTLKPMVVPSTVRHHKYQPSFFIFTIIFVIHPEAIWYSYSHQRALSSTPCLLLQKNSYLLLYDCYSYHDYHCFQLLQLLLSYLFYYFASWIATYFIFNFVYKYYINSVSLQEQAFSTI